MLVIDIGANNGHWSDLLLRRLARSRSRASRTSLIMVEPQPAHASSLERVAARWNGTVLPAIASDKDSDAVELFTSRNSQAASTEARMARRYGGLQPQRLKSIDFARYFYQSDAVRRADLIFLKCDIEAGEYALLPYLLARGVLCRAHFLHIEWHLNGIAPHLRLYGLSLRYALEPMLQHSCGKSIVRRQSISFEEYAPVNFGMPINGLLEVALQRTWWPHHEWIDINTGELNLTMAEWIQRAAKRGVPHWKSKWDAQKMNLSHS